MFDHTFKLLDWWIERCEWWKQKLIQFLTKFSMFLFYLFIIQNKYCECVFLGSIDSVTSSSKKPAEAKSHIRVSHIRLPYEELSETFSRIPMSLRHFQSFGSIWSIV